MGESLPIGRADMDMTKWAVGTALFFGGLAYFMFVYRDPDDPVDEASKQIHWVDRLKPNPHLPPPPTAATSRIVIAPNTTAQVPAPAPSAAAATATAAKPNK